MPILMIGFMYEKNTPARIMVLRGEHFRFYRWTLQRECRLSALTENWKRSIRPSNEPGVWTYKLRRYN